MTQSEYLSKREEYAVSGAPQEVRDEAIRKLDSKFHVTIAVKSAMENFYDAMPEYDNIND